MLGGVTLPSEASPPLDPRGLRPPTTFLLVDAKY